MKKKQLLPMVFGGSILLVLVPLLYTMVTKETLSESALKGVFLGAGLLVLVGIGVHILERKTMKKSIVKEMMLMVGILVALLMAVFGGRMG